MSFTLRQLDAMLVRRKDAPYEAREPVTDLAQAQGMRFLCPACYAKNGGEVGTHGVLCWFAGRGVPDSLSPGPGRWVVSGTGIDDLTLSPSVHLTTSSCGWHGWVQNGSAR